MRYGYHSENITMAIIMLSFVIIFESFFLNSGLGSCDYGDTPRKDADIGAVETITTLPHKQSKIGTVFEQGVLQPRPPPYTPRCDTLPADIYFLLDASGSVGSENFQKQKDFVARFAQMFNIGPNNVQIGVTTFSTSVHHQFYMNAHPDKASSLKAIENIPYQSGSTYTDKAIKYVAANAFTKPHGERDHVVNILITMTDGQSNNHAATVNESAYLHTLPIESFAIGIGSGIRRDELESIASDAHKVFTVTNFNALDSIQSELTKTALACEADGVWSRWGYWSPCTTTCAGGFHFRQRTCNHPPPINGGKICDGVATQRDYCHTDACLTTPQPFILPKTVTITTNAPVDGGWSSWEYLWSPCTATCAGGTHFRKRSCNNPQPTNGGKDCVDVAKQTEDCNTAACPTTPPLTTPPTTLKTTINAQGVTSRNSYNVQGQTSASVQNLAANPKATSVKLQKEASGPTSIKTITAVHLQKQKYTLGTSFSPRFYATLDQGQQNSTGQITTGNPSATVVQRRTPSLKHIFTGNSGATSGQKQPHSPAKTLATNKSPIKLALPPVPAFLICDEVKILNEKLWARNLIIHVGICGFILLVLVIALVCWYRKRKHKRIDVEKDGRKRVWEDF